MTRHPDYDEILGRYFRGEKLIRLPKLREKRAIVLDFLAQSFEPGARYPEREVNRILSRFHDDYAMLRRYMVDEGFMERDRGEYWRAGGSWDIA